MQNIFIISDNHFGHSNILNFLRDDGTKLRGFDTVESMNEYMIQQWNSVVRPSDKIYHLGDLCFKNEVFDKVMPRLNGTKILIKGNHDKLKLSKYAEHFKDVRGSHSIDNYIMTHIPIHTESLSRWVGNIHGHLHYRQVIKEYIVDGDVCNSVDLDYFNVSVECLNYTPIEFGYLKEIFRLDRTDD